MPGRRITLTQYISQSLYAKERDYAIRYIFGGQFNYLLIVDCLHPDLHIYL